MSMGSRRDSEYIGGGQDYGAPGAGTLDPRYGGGSGNPAYPTQPMTDPAAQQQPQHPLKIKFTQEEIRVLRECNRESFYYRCLPLGTLLGCGAYYGVRFGYLKPNARFGPGPKMFLASLVGYFIGKFSYQKVCAEKLMALPNSQLGEQLRRQKGRMGFQETLSMEPGFATAAPVGVPAFSNSEFSQANVYSDVGETQPLASFDTEGSRGLSGYDYNQPSYDTTRQMLDDENLPAKRPQFFTTYDDLRRQNRIEYESKQHRNPVSAPPVAGEPSYPPPAGYDRPRSPSPYSDSPTKPKNKYGDVWDDKPGSY